jgi:hypothetical protein
MTSVSSNNNLCVQFSTLSNAVLYAVAAGYVVLCLATAECILLSELLYQLAGAEGGTSCNMKLLYQHVQHIQRVYLYSNTNVTKYDVI